MALCPPCGRVPRRLTMSRLTRNYETVGHVGLGTKTGAKPRSSGKQAYHSKILLIRRFVSTVRSLAANDISLTDLHILGVYYPLHSRSREYCPLWLCPVRIIKGPEADCSQARTPFPDPGNSSPAGWTELHPQPPTRFVRPVL